MKLSQSRLHPAAPRQISMRSDYGAISDMKAVCEDGCTVKRPPLRGSDRGLWCAAAILAAATGWLMG